jgi:hypothetical protein
MTSFGGAGFGGTTAGFAAGFTAGFGTTTSFGGAGLGAGFGVVFTVGFGVAFTVGLAWFCRQRMQRSNAVFDAGA